MIDKVNSIEQKENGLAASGVTRASTYAIIKKLQNARKIIKVRDSQGNEYDDEVDDLEKQRQGAELALKILGDMTERKDLALSGAITLDGILQDVIRDREKKIDS